LPATAKKERPRGRTKLRALEIAERIVATEGVDGLKLKAIADEIGIQVPSLYKHFDGRDAILRALSEKYVADLASLFEFDDLEDPEAILANGVTALVEIYALHPAWMRLQLRDYSSAEGVEALSKYTGGVVKLATQGQLKDFSNRLTRILRTGVKMGVFREVKPVDLSNLLFGTLCFQITWFGGKVPKKKEIERIQDLMVDVTMRFLRP
jgi:AcrR family transcriptional regulator